MSTVEKPTPINHCIHYNSPSPFQYLIAIKPLGLMYGSAGPFLSPENLVGRSGDRFPPSAFTASGLFEPAYKSTNEPGYNSDDLKQLLIAGPFWSFESQISKGENQNFHVPTPLRYVVELNQQTSDEDDKELKDIQIGRIKYILHFLAKEKETDFDKWAYLDPKTNEWMLPTGKFPSGTWMPIKDWNKSPEDWQNPSKVYFSPWKYLPHLHPRLKLDERHVDENPESGSLFLENAVQPHPDICLVYLSNCPLPNGCYRFGGEGHIIDITCHSLDESIQKMLAEPVGQQFALLTPAIWGSNRHSERYPPAWNSIEHIESVGQVRIFTERALPIRYRLSNRLSRGRYAVPAGTIYRTAEPQSAWKDWNPRWFPTEGISLKRWGCGLALKLPDFQ
jgi:CRISPR-associated protein Cmr3